MKLVFKMNKKGDIPSLIFAVIIIFALGITFLFMNHVSDQLYSSFDQYFAESEDYNNTEAHETVLQIQTVDNSVWDYAFLFLTLGIFLALGLTAFSSRISPIFFWIYLMVSLIVLILGVMFSNAWQTFAANPEFTTTITRFPITNSLLGSYYPLFVTGIIMIMLILLFGKFPGREIT